MAKPGTPVYVVWRGRKPGIYTSWEACKAQVEGYPNALFKAYPTLAMARRAFALGPEALRMPLWALAEPGPQLPALVVDAAAPLAAGGPVEMQGVWLRPGPEEVRAFHDRLEEGTTNAGEFLALVGGLALLHRQRQTMPVYTDSAVALAWFRKGGPPEKVRRRWPEEARRRVERAMAWLAQHPGPWDVRLWDTRNWGENPADFGRK